MAAQASAPPASRRRAQVLLVLAGAIGIPALAGVMHAFPPADYHFYPPCIMYLLTGLHCPGCGGTRCVYALLHLDLAQALAYNALFVGLLPFLLFAGARLVRSLWTGQPLTGSAIPARLGWVILALVLIFTILRNIAVWPLSWLAPHQL